YAPVVVRGGGFGGGQVRLDAGSSSQFLSGLLLAGLAASGPLEIEVERLTSKPYVDLTVMAIETFGGRVERDGLRFRVLPGLDPPQEVSVDGDDSSAAYWAAAAALTGGRVEIDGLNPDSRHGDRGFVDLLVRMGARA
ncbi:MAG: 3-phosphoshikimate 1-carboxyvinyltransferase, partial [Actinobacteria bacterium]|nr:3-phosphoshikimate 1-carboxyvinyltransferase [Actinomycetota bacterium]